MGGDAGSRSGRSCLFEYYKRSAAETERKMSHVSYITYIFEPKPCFSKPNQVVSYEPNCDLDFVLRVQNSLNADVLYDTHVLKSGVGMNT